MNRMTKMFENALRMTWELGLRTQRQTLHTTKNLSSEPTDEFGYVGLYIFLGQIYWPFYYWMHSQ